MNQAQKIIKILAICLAIVIIFNIFGAIISVFTSFIDFGFSRSDNVKEFHQVYENINKIKLDSAFSNVTVKPGENFEVLATGMKSKLSCTVLNETLKIEENNKFLFMGNSDENIIIYIPFDFKLEELDIELGTGKITIDSINAKKFDIEQGAGKIEIINSQFDKTDIDGGAGKIEISSSTLNDLDLDAGVGEVDLNAIITGNSKIDCGVGSININFI